MKENKFHLSKDQCRRARKVAKELALGTEMDQFNKLPMYINEIQRTNPGSTVIMKMEDGFIDSETGKSRFQRLYMCFAGVKQGFLVACRPVICLDGTFLKGASGGVLLTAVGIDPNNGIYPIAYAATEGENKDSWTWFLKLLKEDLQFEKDYEWTIMSDKQKGLIQACEAVLPNSHHKFCVKHLHGNLSTAGFKSSALQKALFGVAKATTPTQFSKKMEYIAALNHEVVKWMEDKKPCEWSRSHFSTFPKCDMILNNICESFNGKITAAREEYIIIMMEALRHNLMERLQMNRDRARKKWKSCTVCPRIRDRMLALYDKPYYCIPYKANDFLFEVHDLYGDDYKVNIVERSCGCRKWDLTRIPCLHAISTLWLAMQDPMEYVDSCYSVKSYLKCYEHCILPLNGENEWAGVNTVPPLPPTYGKQPGRPKKKRSKSAVEIEETRGNKSRQKARRTGQKSVCSFCGECGHNIRTCKLVKRQNGNESCNQDAIQSVQLTIDLSVPIVASSGQNQNRVKRQNMLNTSKRSKKSSGSIISSQQGTEYAIVSSAPE